MVLTRRQQSFKIAGGLNPVQIEAEDDKIINILKRFKNVTYKITLLRLPFPTSVKNDTEQI